MAPLSVLDARPKRKAVKLTTNSRLYKTIIKAIQAKKGEHIISLDLRKIPEAVADFFIICQATSSTQVKAISDYVEEQVKKECGENPYKQEGYQALQWVLIDYVNIVVHIMQPDTRKFYKLEDMWSDAVVKGHEE
ncbi:ribosome silencing factor [Ilyomonas limi]|uniref:Ribosomal silencing factor RsfS n=1 Tax=Ilyomonas limi TaxID=2575867 RepID=A0A4U3KXK4_9BACT|nr:ribosome silencing factor [Ilyomonas limi]TKK66589.1 ribosome silencing factor [Ilyomonas limi]